ncbi:unnamed protein product [Caenorhabditis auriculariae]|uniref:CHK kinase-like domain-containing protein n=1 Tax=Caenorhabditis auriculariae TaxID=2777116 RepID=A0A8S1H5F5_9PELO|nr:unnamed protein product [Caenorhabditis auriculariae]
MKSVEIWHVIPRHETAYSLLKTDPQANLGKANGPFQNKSLIKRQASYAFQISLGGEGSSWDTIKGGVKSRNQSMSTSQNDEYCSDEQVFLYDQAKKRRRTALGTVGQGPFNAFPCKIAHQQTYGRKIKDDFYSTVPIGRHGLTMRWLLNSLGDRIDESKYFKAETSQLSTDGFVSQVFRVKFNQPCPLQVIVKIPETGKIKKALERTTGQKIPDGADEKFIWGLKMFFNREIDFYNMETIPNLRVPKIYHQQTWVLGKQRGAIVMEDLKTMSSVPYYESLNMKQLESVGSQLQALHLFSLDMKDSWSQKFPYPMELIDTVSSMTDIVQLYVSRNSCLVPLFEKLRPIYENRQFFIHSLRDSHRDIGLGDVLCHGDLWFYNLMWKPSSNGKKDQVSNELGAVIDWQNIHTGSIGEDFGHLLAFCCNGPVRRLAEQKYLPLYFEKLQNAASNSQKLLKMTYNQFFRAYKRSFIAHALHLPFIACVMLSVKPAGSEADQFTRNKILAERTKACWEDAIVRLQEEFPEYAI